MADTYRQQIDAGLVEDPGPCEHGCPLDGVGCLMCKIKELELENESLRADIAALEAEVAEHARSASCQQEEL